jgi:putative ATP-dependent endonuclease of the OLD family
MQKIKQTLGVLPDYDVKAFLGLEGKHDINFLERLSRILAATEPDIPDPAAEEAAGRLVFIPLGGSNMDQWVMTLAGLERPEFYVTDRDRPPPDLPKYLPQINAWTTRGATAWATSKREMENYLNPAILRMEVAGYAGVGADFEDVPLLFAEAVHNASPGAPPWHTVTEENRSKKVSNAKRRLNNDCVERMTPALLTQSDPANELRNWLRTIGRALRQ